MRPKAVVTVVFSIHCVAVACVMLIQGCGTSRGSSKTLAPAEPVMPLPIAPPEAPRTRVEIPPPGVTPSIWQGATTTYVIKKGENLSTIAKRFGVSVRAIIELNKIADPDRIYAGQKLRLPGKVILEPTRPKPSAKKMAPRKTSGGNEYIVRKGDSLSKIAVKFGTTVRALRDSNKLTADRILIGQVLAIPSGSPKPTPTVRSVRVPKPVPRAVPVQTRTVVRAPRVPAPPKVVPPAPVAVAERKPEPTVKRPAVEGDYVMHTVAEDEDVYSIAMNYTVLPEELKRLNGLTGNELEVGQKIKIPRPGR